jgi:hypothetical protein
MAATGRRRARRGSPQPASQPWNLPREWPPLSGRAVLYNGLRPLPGGARRGKAGFEPGVSERKLAVVGDLDSGSVTGPFAYTPGDTVLGMPVEYLCVEQEARYGRLAAEPAPGELEQFFCLDIKTLESARAKRRATTPLGRAVQWALCGCPDGGRGLARAERPVVRHVVPGHPPRTAPRDGSAAGGAGETPGPGTGAVAAGTDAHLGPGDAACPGGTGWCPLG